MEQRHLQHENNHLAKPSQSAHRKMNLYKLYKKTLKKEPYNNLNVFKGGFDSFEEFPIISRDSRIKKLQKSLRQPDVSAFLLGLAIFLLNTVHTLARQRREDLELTAITFTRFDADCGPTLVPNLFIYPDPAARDLRQSLIDNQPTADSTEMTSVKNVFITCGFADSFLFLESRFFDQACTEELVRIYAIPRPAR